MAFKLSAPALFALISLAGFYSATVMSETTPAVNTSTSVISPAGTSDTCPMFGCCDVQVDLCVDENYGDCICLNPTEQCVSFTKALSPFDQQLSAVVIPGGWLCTFFSTTNCANTNSTLDNLPLNTGCYPALAQINLQPPFNDKARSMLCQKNLQTGNL